MTGRQFCDGQTGGGFVVTVETIERALAFKWIFRDMTAKAQ